MSSDNVFPAFPPFLPAFRPSSPSSRTSPFLADPSQARPEFVQPSAQLPLRSDQCAPDDMTLSLSPTPSPLSSLASAHGPNGVRVNTARLPLRGKVAFHPLCASCATYPLMFAVNETFGSKLSNRGLVLPSATPPNSAKSARDVISSTIKLRSNCSTALIGEEVSTNLTLGAEARWAGTRGMGEWAGTCVTASKLRSTTSIGAHVPLFRGRIDDRLPASSLA